MVQLLFIHVSTFYKRHILKQGDPKVDLPIIRQQPRHVSWQTWVSCLALLKPKWQVPNVCWARLGQNLIKTNMVKSRLIWTLKKNPLRAHSYYEVLSNICKPTGILPRWLCIASDFQIAKALVKHDLPMIHRSEWLIHFNQCWFEAIPWYSALICDSVIKEMCLFPI